MAGLPVVLGIERSPHSYMVQAAGEAVRITAQDLRTALRHSPSLQAGLQREMHIAGLHGVGDGIPVAHQQIEKVLELLLARKSLLVSHTGSPPDLAQELP